MSEERWLKQFIAGARCPACGLEDKIQQWRQQDGSRLKMHCVACGHEQEMGESAQAPASREAEDEAQPVRFVAKPETKP